MTDPALMVVNRFYDAWDQTDVATLMDIVTHDIEYVGPLTTWRGADEFRAGATTMAEMVVGHRIVKQWLNGIDICTIYDLDIQAPHGPLMLSIADWVQLRDGRIRSCRMYYDAREAAMAFGM